MSANLKKDPITTIAGIIFVIISILMYVLPMFMEVGKDFTEKWYVPLIPLIVGVYLMRSPDSIIRFGNRAAAKKIGKKEGD